MTVPATQEVKYVVPFLAREDKVDPMWSADEDERRLAIIRRAAAGARKTLRNK